MKKVLLTGVALAALASGSALAADLPARRAMPVKAPEVVAYGYNWSGIYVGAHVGGGFGERCFTYLGASEGCHDNDGFLGGGQIGFNVQNGQFVFGAEFSGSWADITGSHTIRGTESYHSDLNTILMLTGRVGLAFDRALLYVTGGGAWTRNKFEYNDGLAYSVTQNRSGWTVGAGVEYGLAPNWSVALQYNYIDLGDKNVNFPGFTAAADSHVHLATARLNYRFNGFGGPVVARY
jgi:outer membrane immunogenic protein